MDLRINHSLVIRHRRKREGIVAARIVVPRAAIVMFSARRSGILGVEQQGVRKSIISLVW